eukprot:6065370-Alexandrium_andersonii.AAC.1
MSFGTSPASSVEGCVVAVVSGAAVATSPAVPVLAVEGAVIDEAWLSSPASARSKFARSALVKAFSQRSAQ